MEATLSAMSILSHGTTDGIIELRRSEKGVFVIVMVAGPESNGENRWTLPFCRAVHKAFDAVEDVLKQEPKDAPAALLTVSTSKKFFSNGIDPAWVMSPKTPKEDLSEWNAITMAAFARPLLLQIPTACAIGGHAFGAGIMFALGHDYRLQSRGRGFLCAIEVAIGMPIPPPELVLFSHDMPANAFHETVLSARKWAADDALRAGVIHQACDAEQLFSEALAYCERQGALLAKSKRALELMKRQTKGHVAKGLIEFNAEAIEQSKAKLSAGLLRRYTDVQRLSKL